MNVTYALERLLETGWNPNTEMDVERLPDGRTIPSVLAIQREFSRAGMELSIKHNLMFGCYRATWSPAGEPGAGTEPGEHHGTVVGSCEREAAVYALAQLRAAQSERTLALV